MSNVHLNELLWALASNHTPSKQTSEWVPTFDADALHVRRAAAHASACQKQRPCSLLLVPKKHFLRGRDTPNKSALSSSTCLKENKPDPKALQMRALLKWGPKLVYLVLFTSSQQGQS